MDNREVPLRISNEWGKFNLSRQRRRKQGLPPVQGSQSPYTRFGMITNAAGNQYKCFACQEVFGSKPPAMDHDCEWETEWREFCNQPVLQVVPGHSKLMTQRIDGLEARIADLEVKLESLASGVGLRIDVDAIKASRGGETVDPTFTAIPGWDHSKDYPQISRRL